MSTRTVVVELKEGIVAAGQHHKTLVLREPTVADMMAAENECPVYNAIGFRAALVAQCVVRVENFDAPVTVGMVKDLKSADWRILTAAFAKLEQDEGN